uniref:DUF4371 domain-containing protein n=1 Tax=Hippocampus comes TaxID=109280 RepID=A0A3Q2XWZ4_HIPCM
MSLDGVDPALLFPILPRMQPALYTLCDKVEQPVSANTEVTSSTNASHGDASMEVAGSSSSSPFAIWSEDMWKRKKEAYLWIDDKDGKLGCKVCSSISDLSVFKAQGSRMGDEWRSYRISCIGTDKSTMLTSLRKKILRHEHSSGHVAAQRSQAIAKRETIAKVCDRMNASYMKATCTVFRTVYHIVQKNRPFSDHYGLMELQSENGIDTGVGLHSCYSATQITDHIEIEGNISVLIDETTSLGCKTALIVYLKCETDKTYDPHFMFLDLIELPNQTADTILQCLLKCLDAHGFDDTYLKKHLVAFASDGASIMLARKSGVAKRMTERYPNILIWHCLNHRLELAVSDTVLGAPGVNHFQAFMDKLYTVYSRSPQNQKELAECVATLEKEVGKIGRVLRTRWVSSSLRTVSAVWDNFEALCRAASDRMSYRGLLKRLTSKQFLLDSALMHDTLNELSLLSECLQRRTASVPYADKLMKRSIRFIEAMGERPGPKVLAAKIVVSTGRFGSVELTDNAKILSINRQQFLRSLSNNISHRMFTTVSSRRANAQDESDYVQLIKQLNVLEPGNWPPAQDMPPGFGETEIAALCQRFRLHIASAINGFRDFIESSGDDDDTPADLRPLMNCTKLIPCNTLIERVSALMFIKLHGPPMKQWDPTSYVTTWLRCHHSAEDRRTRPATETRSELPDPVWRFL